MTAHLGRTLFTVYKKCLNNQNQKSRLLGTYRAAILKDINQPLVIETKEQKKIGKNDVRIKVNYCSVNSADVASFKSTNKQLPFIPGYELSGKVIEVGKNVSKEQAMVGEQVAALSLDKLGGFSDECVVDASDCFRLPGEVSLKDAAVLISAHTTAVYAFSKLRVPKENDIIVITAGPAGLGLAAIDVAAQVFKSKVIAVTESEDRNDFVRQRGAFGTVKFDEKIKDKIYEMTNKKGANIIYDAVGDYMFEKINECVAKHGTVLHAAPILNNISKLTPNTFFAILDLLRLKMQDVELYRTMVNDTLELASEKILSAHISATFSLENVNDAIAYIDSNKCTGKVLIEIGDKSN